MSDAETQGWSLREAAFKTGPAEVLQSLQKAKEHHHRASIVRKATTSWWNGGDLNEELAASSEDSRWAQEEDRCYRALSDALVNKLAAGQLMAKASFKSPVAKPKQILKAAWPYITILKWDPSEAEMPGDDGALLRLYNIRVFRNAVRPDHESKVTAQERARVWIVENVVPLPVKERRGRDVYARYLRRKFKVTERAFLRAWTLADTNSTLAASADAEAKARLAAQEAEVARRDASPADFAACTPQDFARMDRHLEKLAELTGPDSPYTATARACLRANNLSHLIKSPEEAIAA